MNVLNKLTKRNLALNKKRTIVTIIGIILSTALLVCVSGMVTSFRKTLINDTIKDNGYYHVKVDNMTEEDINILKDNRNIADFYLESEIGYVKFSSKNERKPYIYLTSFDKKALENLPVNVIEGRFPQNENEILISKYMIEDGGFSLKIGEDIVFDIGDRVSYKNGEKSILNQNNPFNYYSDDEEKEDFEFKLKKTYKVVGIMDRMSYTLDRYDTPGYACITYKEKEDNLSNAYILYKNAGNYDKYTKDIVSDKYNYKYNNEYLRYLGVLKSGTMNALYLVALVVIGIIIISSVFVIKNSFAISITEKYKMYGMLRSVGATSKQIKKNVLYEGFFLGLIAIPIGILIGILAVIILVLLINLIIGDFLAGVKFVYSVPLIPILVSIILASLTIYFSTIFTSRRAGKISAIDAIRSNNDIKIQRKKLKTPKIISKLFKTGGVIAYKNLKRNKKKYRTTVVSIVVSIFVFISLSSFINFGFKMAGTYYKNLDYNFTIFDSENNNNFDKIQRFDGIERMSLIREDSLKINDDVYSDFGKKISDLYVDDTISITIASVGDEEFNRFMKKIGLNDKNKAILIDEYKEIINKKTYVGNLYNYKNNDTINGTILDNGKSFKIEIVRSNERPMGLENTYSNSGFLIVSDEIFNTYFSSLSTSLNLKVSNTKEFTERINNLKKEDKNYSNIMYNNLEEFAREQNSMILIVSIFLYGFITVISLIGITNIFNTITTNMNLRSKEFAMLKSIGMTHKEFNRMIRLESIFYGFKSLIIGIPLGLIGSYLIYKAFQSGLDFGYELPINALIIVVIFVSIIIGIIMKYSLSKINKQNIIDTIRNDNI